MLNNWTLAGANVKDDQIPAWYYKLAGPINGSFSTFNPGNSGWNQSYLVGWDSAVTSSSSSSSSSGSGGGGYSTADANNLQNFLSDLLGYSYLDNSNGLHRVLPEYLGDWPVFYAEKADVKGEGNIRTTDNLGINTPTARVTVSFKPLDFDVVPDDELSGEVGQELERYVRRGGGFSSQYLTLDGKFKYCTDPTQQLGTSPGKNVGEQELNYTWMQIPGLIGKPFVPPNMKAIVACIGCVNNKPFDTVAGINGPPGTVLFSSVDVKMELPSLGGSQAQPFLTNGGLYTWTETFKFLYRNYGTYSTAASGYPGQGGNALLNGVPIGHQFKYRTYGQSTGHFLLRFPFWDLISADGQFTITAGTPPVANGILLYQQADLNTLFTISG